MAASFQRFQTSGFSSTTSDNGNTEADGYDNSTALATASYRVNDALAARSLPAALHPARTLLP
ncbi:hypothetical protein [Pleomorphomonas sp. PLEO]|uniref:hypothetical protein n=1 Tax=Pleomorphomonas sp. PLEO TaxID=3239306 RepID=UPI00351DE575